MTVSFRCLTSLISEAGSIRSFASTCNKLSSWNDIVIFFFNQTIQENTVYNDVIIHYYHIIKCNSPSQHGCALSLDVRYVLFIITVLAGAKAHTLGCHSYISSPFSQGES